jgi:DNA-binding beta-propeller fold protein YncE
MRSFPAALLALLAATGCGAPEPPGSTGGTTVAPGPCGRGIGVVQTDYQSTNVSLLDWEGHVLSSSFISSATAGAKLSAKLTGDVALPTTLDEGNTLVLLDRYPASVLTWVTLETAEVTAQLSVRSGFDANPHDYLALSAHRALVTRFNRNPAPDALPLDRGDDVLVLDLDGPTAVSSIDLSPAMAGVPEGFRANPHRMVLAGDRVVVTLLGKTADHSDAVASRLAVIDPTTLSVEQVLVLDGLYECNGIAVSPTGDRVAVSCSGRFGGGSEPMVSESAIVVVALGSTLEEIARVPASPSVPFGFGVAWAASETVVANTFGRFSSKDGPARSDTVVEIELVGLTARTLLESADEPFTLGDVRCGAACATCFASDAGRGLMHRFSVDASGRVGPPSPIQVKDAIGLPPRTLGQF